MKLSYLKIKNKCFLRSPGFVIAWFSVLLTSVAAILLRGEIASYALQIIVYLPAAVCILYHFVNYQEGIVGMMRLEKVYYGVFEIRMSEFCYFSFFSLVYYIQLIALVLGLGHKYVNGHFLEYIFMGLIMWLYTECLYLIGELAVIPVKNSFFGIATILFAAFIPPFVNLYKYSYLSEIKRLFGWSGLDAHVKEITGKTVNFGLGTAHGSMDVRVLCACFLVTLIIYAAINSVKAIKCKEWRK